MRSAIYGKAEFFVRMNRKPAQEILYQKVLKDELTDDEIEKCGQAKWVREALFELKTRHGKTQSQVALELANNAVTVKFRENPVYLYTGPQVTIRSKSNSKLNITMDYELNTNSYILMDEKAEQIKTKDSLLQVTIHDINKLKNSSTFVNMMSDMDFVTFINRK
jgi:DNA helicase TIP49 (TBP-interacting protein)